MLLANHNAGLFGLCLLALGQCLGCAGLPKAPAYPEGARAQFADHALQLPGLAEDPAPALTLQPGDSIRVDVASTDARAIDGVVVDATGMVHLPLAGDVEVGGLGLTAAEAQIQDALRRYDRLVSVSVQLTDRGGQRATVLGAVQREGAVELIPGARVTDLIASAGGLR